MKTANTPFVAAAGLIVGLAFGLGARAGETPAPQEHWQDASATQRQDASATRTAAAKITAALRSEPAGQNARRGALLESALEQAPSNPIVRWHNGYVRAGRKWVRFDEVPGIVARDEATALYRRCRQDYPDTVQGQMSLAAWCDKNGLADQCRAHLSRVLALAPDHKTARRLLGYRLVDGVWLSADEVQQAGARATAAVSGLRQWQPVLAEIRAGLMHGLRSNRQRAAERLQAIDDPAAVPAIELALCGHSEPMALAGVAKLADMQAVEAAVALARQGVFSPWPSIRRAAAVGLKRHDWENFVPVLLSAMKAPIQSRMEIYQDPIGRLFYRHAFYREGQDRNELRVLDAMYRHVFVRTTPVSMSGGPGTFGPNGSYRAVVDGVRPVLVQRDGRIMPDPNPSAPGRLDLDWSAEAAQRSYNGMKANELDREAAAQAAWASAAQTAYSRETAIARENAMTQDLNQRVCSVLATATDISLPPWPEYWSQWWADATDVLLPGYRPTVTDYGFNRQTYVTPDHIMLPPWNPQYDITTLYTPPPPPLPGDAIICRSCLAAGTPVWTEEGLVAVEEIRLGDRVLSQDVETGELAYKPVLGTTVRPAPHLLKLELLDDAITCSAGHPFWVAGRGWVKAFEIPRGANFHGVEGTTPLRQTLSAPGEPVYNLIVADFHTYFVGAAMVLSHDTTTRRPTNTRVPGLAGK